MPTIANPARAVWTDIGGDLEAAFDGGKYVIVRDKRTHREVVFLSKSALRKLLSLVPSDLPRQFW